MSRTDKDKPYALRNRKSRKHHGGLMRTKHVKFCGKDCCGFTHDVNSARSIDKRKWRLIIRRAGDLDA